MPPLPPGDSVNPLLYVISSPLPGSSWRKHWSQGIDTYSISPFQLKLERVPCELHSQLELPECSLLENFIKVVQSCKHSEY